MKEDVPAWEVRATDSGLAVWRICFERRLEPRAAELPRNDGPIAGEESVHDPPSNTLGDKGVARSPATMFAAAGLTGNLMASIVRYFIDML